MSDHDHEQEHEHDAQTPGGHDAHCPHSHMGRLKADFPVQWEVLNALAAPHPDGDGGLYLDTEKIYGARSERIRLLLGQMVVDFPPMVFLAQPCKADLFRMFSLALGLGAALERTRALVWGDEAPLQLDPPPTRAEAEDKALAILRLWRQELLKTEAMAVARGSIDVDQMKILGDLVEALKAVADGLPGRAVLLERGGTEQP